MSKKKQPPSDHLTIPKGRASEQDLFALQVLLVDELVRRMEHPAICTQCGSKGLSAAVLGVIRQLLKDNSLQFDSSRRAGMRGGLEALRLLALPFTSKGATDKETEH